MGGQKGVKQYPVIPAENAGPDVVQYLKNNPQVSGMAWGAGQNDSPINEPRSVIVNPYNIYLKTPHDTNNLIHNERIRHQMDETKWKGKFDITPEQKEWAKTLGAYSTNPEMLKQTIVARLASGEYVPNPTKEEHDASKKFLPR